MENKLVIKGGKKLRGEVTISSSKNAAVAILPAVVLGSEIVKLYDVPHIEDVHVLIQLLQELTGEVTRIIRCLHVFMVQLIQRKQI